MHWIKNLSPKTQGILAVIFLILIIAGLMMLKNQDTKNQDTQNADTGQPQTVTTFEQCVEAGNPVMESYPRQCRTPEGQSFTENIGNALEKSDLIQLENPLPNQVISSPLEISGQARGQWFFEATFPVVLTDWDGLIIAEGFATAEGEWMTEEFVPFTATLRFEKPAYGENGALILQKDNPSGLPENDDALEIPVRF
jgi:hypothetical protein